MLTHKLIDNKKRIRIEARLGAWECIENENRLQKGTIFDEMHGKYLYIQNIECKT